MTVKVTTESGRKLNYVLSKDSIKERIRNGFSKHSNIEIVTIEHIKNKVKDKYKEKIETFSFKGIASD